MSSLYGYVNISDLPISTQVAIPHFAIPFRFKVLPQGSAATVHEQDTFEEVRDCVAAIVRYTRGQRPEAPEFGITPVEFTQGIDFPKLLQEIEENEPRAHMLASSSLDPLDQSIDRVVIEILENETGTQSGGGSNV
jgi:hypothetical protein